MTRVLTDKRIRLVNAMGNILESFLQIEHCNSQPEDINLMYTAETSIILMLVGDLPVHSELIVNYGEMGFSMKGHSLT